MRPFSPLRALCGAAAWALLSAAPAAAADSEASACLKTKVWSGYNEGWHVRTTTEATLGQGEHRVFLVTLYAGNEYKFSVCADSKASDIDLVLHDATGKEVARDQGDDREPTVSFKATRTDTYYVAVYASTLVAADQKSGVAFAVTYK